MRGKGLDVTVPHSSDCSAQILWFRSPYPERQSSNLPVSIHWVSFLWVSLLYTYNKKSTSWGLY